MLQNPTVEGAPKAVSSSFWSWKKTFFLLTISVVAIIFAGSCLKGKDYSWPIKTPVLCVINLLNICGACHYSATLLPLLLWVWLSITLREKETIHIYPLRFIYIRSGHDVLDKAIATITMCLNFGSVATNLRQARVYFYWIVVGTYPSPHWYSLWLVIASTVQGQGKLYRGP